MDNFSLSNILEIKKSKETKDNDVIRYHYNKAITRIKDSYNHYSDYCYYTVPEYTATLPPYDAKKISIKMVKYCRIKGFNCKLVPDGSIYFEWKPKERPRDHIPYLLKNIYLRIKHESENNHDYLLYETPKILPEFPWYDTLDTAEHLAKVIAEKGFIVKIQDSILFICWNVKELEKKSKVKINFETVQEKKRKALDKINLINENRYVDFINPKLSKIDFKEPEQVRSAPKNEFDISKVLNLYR